MKLIDSHCHLHDREEFPLGAEGYLERARAAGVEKVVVIGTSYDDSLAARDFAGQMRARSWQLEWTFGVHPCEVAREYREPEWGELRPLAIGEVGLDYHYAPGEYLGAGVSFEEMRRGQWRLLEQMLELGLRHGLPFSFHVREAFEDFFAILENFPQARGVVHSFSDNKRNLRRVLERGLYVGVNGMATYSTLPRPPLERMLLETDAPWLAPASHRGERNEPAYVREVAEWVSREYGVALEEVARATGDNFRECFAGTAGLGTADSATSGLGSAG